MTSRVSGIGPNAEASFRTLRLVLADQLNAQHHWYHDVDESVVYLLAELRQETDYTTHHVQKVCSFFAAMEAFANDLRTSGHHVVHLTLDDTADFCNLDALLEYFLEAYSIAKIEYQLPDEYRLRRQLSQFLTQKEIPCSAVDSEHFLISDHEIESYFQEAKAHRMEAFYRKMRQRFDILMVDGKPEGGAWNYDQNNRQKLKAEHLASIPIPLKLTNDVSKILKRLQRHGVQTIGEADTHLLWPINRVQAIEQLDFFCHFCLPCFGQFQDAMTANSESAWSLYHSRISFALNAKILSPLEVIDVAIQYYRANPTTIDIAQIEGFVRQILGWREFVRGIYWANMPKYSTLNTLTATRPLPEWFWTGNTKMRCQRFAIEQSLQFSYAHHIQRLMVTGNFCLIAGIHPDEVDNWYLGIYIDAIEWVELPNTRGMSQFADGGLLASKAYAASGNYVNKMSDYCKDCFYSVKAVMGERACPLNSLYWHFMSRHEDKFSVNRRNRMVYANWRKKSPQEQRTILHQADLYLKDLNQL
ncbi:cryptochrome/photolyase family protein [uncultured Umboniibacter sp.]|uniref:cryptochrome/photolyase family protein n=1 Tax=uncultured Umboniibacter sp. TaxID=1798917 RepID=UPI002610E06E|nr:cryptochrome/photolyase family protein [uncultured Umboniibacter sp.]